MAAPVNIKTVKPYWTYVTMHKDLGKLQSSILFQNHIGSRQVDGMVNYNKLAIIYN